jgi:DNA polymerase elongation subunit (family B)
VFIIPSKSHSTYKWHNAILDAVHFLISSYFFWSPPPLCCHLLVTKAIDKIMTGGEEIQQQDLVISKLLGQDIEKYKSLFPHVSPAIQLIEH